MTLREIATLVGGHVEPANESIEIKGVAPLTDAAEGDISFFGDSRYLKSLRQSSATAVLVPHGFGEQIHPIRIWVDRPSEAFAKLLEKFVVPRPTFQPGIHPSAVVAPNAQLGAGIHIGANSVIEQGAVIGDHSVIAAGSYIGHDARIGSDCLIYPNVVMLDRSIIGDRVIIHSGVIIGSDGFGYELRDGKNHKIPQTGFVQIDDDVEIGANTTVDRARFGRTWIQKGVKIDNLCQIAHNVIIGENSILCAQVGISGSARIGKFVTLAGKVGVNGHIEIQDGAVVMAMAGVTKSVPQKEILCGLPARPVREFKETFALTRNIQKLFERVKALEKKLENS